MTTVVGLITDNDETAYREVRDLTVWSKDNNFSLNMIKTKEMIVDYSKRRTEHTPILIDRAVHLVTWSACTSPGLPQESLMRDETSISLPAKPSLTRRLLGHLGGAP